jgi:hypothetical protein
MGLEKLRRLFLLCHSTLQHYSHKSLLRSKFSADNIVGDKDRQNLCGAELRGLGQSPSNMVKRGNIT